MKYTLKKEDILEAINYDGPAFIVLSKNGDGMYIINEDEEGEDEIAYIDIGGYNGKALQETYKTSEEILNQVKMDLEVMGEEMGIDAEYEIV